MLAIEMLLLTGNYAATAYNDRNRCEWPPHPARLFSALVATHHAQEDPALVERDALRWLAEQGAPQLTASDTDTAARRGRATATVFVPVNDTTLLGRFDDVHLADQQARAAVRDIEARVQAAKENGAPPKELAKLDKRLAATVKAADKAKTKLDGRIAKAIAPTDAAKPAAMKTAQALFPEHRGRQPRTFPSIAPESPVVVFTWPHAAPSDDVRAALGALLARVVRVGHSSSLVRLRLLDNAPEPTLVPDENATERLRVPLPGQLERLEEDFARHQETLPRVLPAGFQGYAARAVVPEATPRTVFEDEWLVFELVRPAPRLGVPIQRATDIAHALRGAVLRYASDPPPEALSGHSPDGSPSERPHLAYLPLPHVGSRHADGRVLGIALVLPRGCSDDDRRAVFQGAWRACA